VDRKEEGRRSETSCPPLWTGRRRVAGQKLAVPYCGQEGGGSQVRN
jgi:hypothetical protein